MRLACADLLHTGRHTRHMSSTEQEPIFGYAPHFVFVSVRRRLFLAVSLPLVLSMCFLKVSARSRVTPR